MNIASIRPPTLDGVKKLAKQLKRENKITHTAALEAASRQAGFESYVHARRVLPAAISAAVAGQAGNQHIVYLTAHWREPYRAGTMNGQATNSEALGGPRLRAGRELLQVSLSLPLTDLIAKHRVGKARGLSGFVMEYADHLELHRLGESQDEARRSLLLAERALRFMETTGLQPVSLQKQRNLLREVISLKGNDHTSQWHDATTGSVALLNEPYRMSAERQRGERTADLANTNFAEVSLAWEGLYNPGETAPSLCSPDSALLARIYAAVSKLPNYAVPTPWATDSGPCGEGWVSPQRIRDSKKRKPIPSASYAPRFSAIPYGGSFGQPSSWRPMQPLLRELHLELGAIFQRLGPSGVPWKVSERLRTHYRSELENWANLEHQGEDLGYQAYYDQQVPRYDTVSQSLAGLARARSIVSQGYNVCRPQRELIAAIDAFAQAISKQA